MLEVYAGLYMLIADMIDTDEQTISGWANRRLASSFRSIGRAMLAEHKRQTESSEAQDNTIMLELCCGVGRDEDQDIRAIMRASGYEEDESKESVTYYGVEFKK